MNLTAKNAKNAKPRFAIGILCHLYALCGKSPFHYPQPASRIQRKGAEAQRGKPQPKKLNMRKQRKQRGKNFAENAEFSQIALQSRKEVKNSLHGYSRELRIFGKLFPSLLPLFPQFAPVRVRWLRLAALRHCGFAPLR